LKSENNASIGLTCTTTKQTTKHKRKSTSRRYIENKFGKTHGKRK
jgi:hypothetical protein